ncbi:MAG: LamB/YcsF family protein [Rhodospirillales bacterium]|nr:LamB/YcsF family protein [Rhodospirillales bacterium]
MKLDLNADVGEGMAADEALLGIVTSASIACAAHAGDEASMRAAIDLCLKHGVGIGAHPGYADRANFGRMPHALPPQDIAALVADQTRLLMRLTGEAGGRVMHVKPHGALSNQAMADRDIARAIAQGIASASPDLIFLAPSGSAMVSAGREMGLKVVEEIFADRAYDRQGFLVPRSQAGAVLHDPSLVAERTLFWLKTGRMKALSGKEIPLPGQSVCLHGDTAEAVAIAQTLRHRLLAEGVTLAQLSLL